MTKTAKLYDALVLNNDVLTAKQIRARYKIANPSRAVHYLNKTTDAFIFSDTTINSKGVVRHKYADASNPTLL